MQQVFDAQTGNSLEFIVGDAKTIEHMTTAPGVRIFDGIVIEFLNDLSKAVMSLPPRKSSPDLVAFAYYIRKTNILRIGKGYSYESDRIGKGVAFHIAPSNVALSFAYTLVYGLLAGNANIVRMPTRDFEQTALLCKLVCDLLTRDCYCKLKNCICLVKYPRDKKTNDILSGICNIRIIWGGDKTIENIRQSPLPPRASEITFSDRYSISLIDSDKYLDEYDCVKAAKGFYTDTYLSDQNACSSPRIIVWFGGRREEAKTKFWSSLQTELSDYDLPTVRIVDKMTAFYKYASYENCRIFTSDDFKIVRVQTDILNDNLLNNLCNCGYFYEYDAGQLEEILPICSIKCQTLSYLGFEPEAIQAFLLENAPRGVDRVVPVGKTMSAGLIWDGRDLLREMSRKIALE